MKRDLLPSQLHTDMTAWRRDIHAHPELGFEEVRTSDIVAKKLAEFGIEVHRGIGKTGVVGVLKAGSSKRTVGLRADMDALPIQEANTFAHKSTHDGTVHFIFQPAEEGIGGAKAMIDDGLFKRFPCEALFGMHNRPGMPLGKFAVRAGPMMAGGAFFDIDITGRGSHGARPESSVDPVLVAAHLATALQSIVARNVRPVETAVLSVTQIHAGDAYNVIPQTARLSGTARAFSNEVMEMMGRNVARLAESIAAGFGAKAKTDWRATFPPLINDAKEADFAASVCNDIVGEQNVRRDPALIMASEDFAFMLNEIPGCYINIGNGDGEGACEVHNPAYDFNDAALPYGASFFVRLVEKRLAKP
jgi:amidohydrolase